MSKHTPGPWERDGRTVYALNEHGHNRFSAGVQDCFTPEEELLANAQLMAAAPDLLEALKNARSLLNHCLTTDTVHVGDSDQSGHPHGWCAVRIPDWKVKQALEWMDADIAKAEAA